VFDTSAITEVYPPIREGGRLTLEWASSTPPNTWFQIYLAGQLFWWGTDLHATVNRPGPDRRADRDHRRRRADDRLQRG
jgi:hypothetical protein